MIRLGPLILIFTAGLLLVLCGASTIAQANRLDQQKYVPVKVLGFNDPNTHTLYKVTSYNATPMAAQSTQRSKILVHSVKLDENTRLPVGEPVQTQDLALSNLVDFDLHCLPSHCYLVTLSGGTRRNVKLYAWQRTHFDDQATRDSFSRARAVKLVRIGSGFYIALAQEQLHLNRYRIPISNDDEEEPSRFMGCAVLKFVRGHERDLKYHQFIRLPFNPNHVNYFTTVNSNNLTDAPYAIIRPTTNHHLVFSAYPNWTEQVGQQQVNAYIWSPLNDYFWPYRMPRSAEFIQHRPGTHILRLPKVDQLKPANLTTNNQQQDYINSVEVCFHQLQRVLADRDLQARKLIESSRSIWRAPSFGQQQAATGLTNISAQVIVHGNVTVLGSLIESPQITVIGGDRASSIDYRMPLTVKEVAHLVKSHSPTRVEDKFRRALYKLNDMRDKLAHAIPANLALNSLTYFNNRIRFIGGIQSNEVILSGIANSYVRLNGIPFSQLENELVSLNGPQDIGAQVVFNGRVTADVLEIHGVINDYFMLKNAIDITSNRVQIIDTTGQNYITQAPGMPTVVFQSVSSPDIILDFNASFNNIKLNDFITRDNRTQQISGRKTFKRLYMARLDLTHQGVLLNGMSISKIARNAIRLRTDATTMNQSNTRMYQSLKLDQAFMKRVSADKLMLNNIINQHINLTSLIHDSVKTNIASVQQIYGQKNFLNGLKINHLTTEGLLNGIEVRRVFNLNAVPPVYEHYRYTNSSAYGPQYDVSIAGEFKFGSTVTVLGSVRAGLVNGVDLARRAIRRVPVPVSTLSNGTKPDVPPQIVHGRKIFYRPLRVIHDVRLLDLHKIGRVPDNTRVRYPLINGIDLKLIYAGLKRQLQQPSLINVDNLEIDGNLEIPSLIDPRGTPQTTFGNYSSCPLNLIRSRAVLAGSEDQFIETPIRVNSLRAKSIIVDSGALNDAFNFPNDFVLRTPMEAMGDPNVITDIVEPIYGVKSFEHLVVSPSLIGPKAAGLHRGQTSVIVQSQGVLLDRGASINQVPYSELRTFVSHEQKRNSTGEKVLATMNVYGNLHSKRINGYYWPDDILLKSLSSTRGVPTTIYQHKRIYSHLIFTNSSNLHVENQLVLRGPVQLLGRMNGVNLTEFSRQSATYGDKDLYSIGRPIRNKIFMGGLTVRGEIRSQGLIEGVSFDEMKQRVVTIGPTNKRVPIMSPKIFMSDSLFQNHINMIYLNDLPMDNYLRRIRFEPDGSTLKVYGKKAITGALRINRNLFVRGLINGIDFAELKARAISLAPTSNELTFNKTLIVEGDVFMDNLWIDERNGTIDGVKLTNLLPIGTSGNNELILSDPRVSRRADAFGRTINVVGSLMDCQVTCSLQPMPNEAYVSYGPHQQSMPRSGQFYPGPPQYKPQPAQPVVVPAQSVMAYTSRPVTFNHQPLNYTLTRTTPPYGLPSTYQPPMMITTPRPMARPVNQAERVQQLVQRRPVSIKYEQKQMPSKRYFVPERVSVVSEQLEFLRNHIISINLVRLSSSSNLVVGFIEAPTNDVSAYSLSDQDMSHFDHVVSTQRSYLQLDQIDFPFRPTIYHLSVGVSTDPKGQNVTRVFSSLGGSSLHELSVLPIEFPNSALFINIPDVQVLFLLISQDYSINAGVCATSEVLSSSKHLDPMRPYHGVTTSRAESGVHVYLFHALQNSSSLTSAYFDLYQTIDLPGIDSFEKFTYNGSSYVLAVSRVLGRIYLLLLRGYTGFQVVSHIYEPMIDHVTIMYSLDSQPVLIIHQTSGLHRIMEAVVI